MAFFCHVLRSCFNCLYNLDWLGCPYTRRSRTCYILMLGGAPISWKIKKQLVVSRSSVEADYRAMASTVSEILWVRWLLKDLQVVIDSSKVFFVTTRLLVTLQTTLSFMNEKSILRWIAFLFVRGLLLKKIP